jgi:WD40 repeat protein
VEWNPDGRRLLTAGHNDEVLVWDVRTGVQLLGRCGHGAFNRVARWSAMGASSSHGMTTKSAGVGWRNGEAVTPLLNHSGDVALRS